jgi:hypothetical protein
MKSVGTRGFSLSNVLKEWVLEQSFCTQNSLSEVIRDSCYYALVVSINTVLQWSLVQNYIFSFYLWERFELLCREEEYTPGQPEALLPLRRLKIEMVKKSLWIKTFAKFSFCCCVFFHVYKTVSHSSFESSEG